MATAKESGINLLKYKEPIPEYQPNPMGSDVLQINAWILRQQEIQIVSLAYELESAWPPESIPAGLSVSIDKSRQKVKLTVEDYLEGFTKPVRIELVTPGVLPARSLGVNTDTDLGIDYDVGIESDKLIKHTRFLFDSKGNKVKLIDAKVSNDSEPQIHTVSDGELDLITSRMEEKDMKNASKSLDLIQQKLQAALGKE